MKAFLKIMLVSYLITFSHSTLAWERMANYDAWVDKETMTTEKEKGGKIVTIWAFWDLQPGSSLPAKSVKGRLVIDCKNRILSMFDVSLYSDSGAKGNKTHGDSLFGTAIEPDTMFNDMHKQYCKDWWKVW